MEVTLYTIKGCNYCDMTKELMRRASLDYTLVLVGRDMTKAQMEKKFPLAKGFPYVIIDGQAIPGLQATAKYLVDRGFASKMRKTKVSNCKSCNQ